MAPHSSTLAWKIPWMEEPCGLQSMGSLRVEHDWATSLSLFTFMHWRRQPQPTPVFLPGESQGQGSLLGCHLWGRTVGHDWVTKHAHMAVGGSVVKTPPARWMDKEVVIHIHNGILLSYKKEHIWVSSNEVDETGTYYTERSKPEREIPIQYINTYIWNLERW